MNFIIFYFLSCIFSKKLDKKIEELKIDLDNNVNNLNLLLVFPMELGITDYNDFLKSYDYEYQNSKRNLPNTHNKLYIFEFEHKITYNRYLLMIDFNRLKKHKDNYDMFTKNKFVSNIRTLDKCMSNGCYQKHLFQNHDLTSTRVTKKPKIIYQYCLDLFLPFTFLLDDNDCLNCRKKNNNVEQNKLFHKSSVKHIFDIYLIFKVFKLYDNITKFAFVNVSKYYQHIKNNITNLSNIVIKNKNELEFLLEFNKVMFQNTNDKKYQVKYNKLDYIYNNLNLIFNEKNENAISNIINFFKTDFSYIIIILNLLYKENENFFNFLVNPIKYNVFLIHAEAYMNLNSKFKNYINEEFTELYKAKTKFPELLKTLFQKINTTINNQTETQESAADIHNIKKYKKLYIESFKKINTISNPKRNRIIRIVKETSSSESSSDS